MGIGPVEYIIIDFPGSKVNKDIVPALKELIASGTIRIIDMVFIRKGTNGQVEPLELSQLDLEDAMPFEELDGEIDDLINAEDIQSAAAELPPDSIAGVFVWEDVWATRFAEAVRSTNGRVIADARIPNAVVEAAFEAAVATDA
ncbi:MAG: DUF6325 family protein [Ktedonobacterales bacterium]